MVSNKLITLRIAGLNVILNARDSNLDVTVPRMHSKFLIKYFLEPPSIEKKNKFLRLDLQDGHVESHKTWGMPLCITELWELWQAENDQFVFISSKQTPPRLVIIDSKFEQGHIILDFSEVPENFYPLNSIDIRIIVNWLACFGDLILHAAGIAYNQQGYCFIGHAKAGKSTLMDNLSKKDSVTVLGEDQVILRYIDDRFWIFGTPWHERESMCSPIGVPLKKIFFLERESQQKIHRIPVLDGFAYILKTAFVPYYLPEKVKQIMNNLTLLGEQIPFFKLSYVLDSDILPLILD